MTDTRSSRRRFLFRAAVTAGALPLLPLLGQPAQAAALKKLPVDHAQAKALKYRESVVGFKDAAFKPGSICGNCQFFTAATGACTLFPGFSVAAQGWCSAWAKKA